MLNEIIHKLVVCYARNNMQRERELLKMTDTIQTIETMETIETIETMETTLTSKMVESPGNRNDPNIHFKALDRNIST